MEMILCIPILQIDMSRVSKNIRSTLHWESGKDLNCLDGFHISKCPDPRAIKKFSSGLLP